MFMFLQYSVAAVTNKIPHLQDIKGFLILILISEPLQLSLHLAGCDVKSSLGG